MSGRDQAGQDDSRHSPGAQSTGTGGGGNAARDKSPVPTSEAPTPAQLDEPAGGAPRPVPKGSAATTLQPGGTTPRNAPLAGEGQIGSGGGSSGPTGGSRR
jgi:hypothetical protein